MCNDLKDKYINREVDNGIFKIKADDTPSQ